MLPLARLLREIKHHDTDYDQRYLLVVQALALAVECGYQAGIRIDARDADWPVVYIELPTGQVSWHMLAHQREWDGHDTPEKYARVERFCAQFGGESL